MYFLPRNFKKQNQKGFTLVELLVTITIFVVLTGVVLFNQSKFNSTILLTNLAYDTALTIRQAQTYGLNIKEFGGTTAAETQFVPYGVHFDLDANKSFILFADLDYTDAAKSDGIYNKPGSGDHSNPAICQGNFGCVSRYSIKRGNFISQLCVDSKTDASGIYSDGDCTMTKLDIVFQRPNPDAFIRAGTMVVKSNPIFNDATIIIQGADGSTRKVKVQSNGLIEIKH